MADLAEITFPSEEKAEHVTTDKILPALQGEGGTVIRTSFDESKEGALRTVLAVAIPVAAPSAS